jgi:hypothetical protein
MYRLVFSVFLLANVLKLFFANSIPLRPRSLQPTLAQLLGFEVMLRRS